jgi:hypothetical protein
VDTSNAACAGSLDKVHAYFAACTHCARIALQKISHPPQTACNNKIISLAQRLKILCVFCFRRAGKVAFRDGAKVCELLV